MDDSGRYAYLRGASAQDWQLQEFGEVDDPNEGAIHGGVPGAKEAAEAAAELPQPPTLEEIEAIQQTAWQEGFDQGKQEGFDKGLAEGRLKGAEQGLQQGLEQGRSEGIEAGANEIAQRCAQLDRLLDQLIAPLQAVDEQVERELVTLAMKLAHAVVQVELQTNSTALLYALQSAVATLPQQKQAVTIMANADDKALIEQSYGNDELEKRQWQLQLEPAMAKGSLQINTERSQVAVMNEERLRQILEQFASAPRAAVAEPEYPTHSAPTETTIQAESAAAEPEPDQIDPQAEPQPQPQATVTEENADGQPTA